MKHAKALCITFVVQLIVIFAADAVLAGIPIEIPPAQLRTINKAAMEQKKAIEQYQRMSEEYNKELKELASEFSKTEPGSKKRHELAKKLTDKYVGVFSEMVDPLEKIDAKFAKMQKAIEEAKKKAKPVNKPASFEQQKKAFNEWLDVTQDWIDRGVFKNSFRIQKALKGIRDRLLISKVHRDYFIEEDLDNMIEDIITLRLEIRNYAKAMKGLLTSIIAARQEGVKRRIIYNLDSITELFDQGIVSHWIDIGPEVLDSLVEVPEESAKNISKAKDVNLRSLKFE